MLYQENGCGGFQGNVYLWHQVILSFMAHMLMGGNQTLQSKGHIIAHGQPLDRPYRILAGILGLW